MHRLNVTFNSTNAAENMEVLAALFNMYEVDGIEQQEQAMLVYVSEDLLQQADFKNDLNAWSTQFEFSHEIEELPNINWNKAWESNFEPVFVDDFLTIKADFHQIESNTKHIITINPKMSFGTGHHATTWMMSRLMSYLNFQNKKVLDAGSGTGVLAILAHQLGANEVIAFDNDEWCYTNAIENFEINNCPELTMIEGSLESIDTVNFDIILANINRNFLIENGAALKDKLKSDGLLMLSGFLSVDTPLLLNYFNEQNMVAQYLLTKDDWNCVVLKKRNE